MVLPTQEEVGALISKVFCNLGVEVEEFPFTLESAKASLIRIVQKVPPSSDKNQQFKDGVLWEDCLTVLRKDPVFLVTNDQSFYNNRDTKRAFADQLSEDLKQLPANSLPDLLAEIGTGVHIDPASFIAAYLELNGEKMKTMAENHSFGLEGEPTTDLRVFATEKPTLLYVTFTIELPCFDATSERGIGAKILARGEGSYDSGAKKFVEIRNQGEQFVYQLRRHGDESGKDCIGGRQSGDRSSNG